MNSIHKNSFLFHLILLIQITSIKSYPTQIQTVFNTPGFNDGQTSTIADALIKMIHQTPKGASIYGSVYIYQLKEVSWALLQASARGVNVELVLDGRNKKDLKLKNSAVNLVVNGSKEFGLGKLKCLDKKCVHFCSGSIRVGLVGGSCRGFTVNHNKFFLFSELSNGTKNIIFQTSSNLARDQFHQYNDAVTIYNDQLLYDGFLDYWKKLKLGKTNWSKRLLQIHNTDKNIHVLFLPSLTAKEPVLAFLNRVSCHLSNSKIHLTQSVFRNKSVAKKLAELKSSGCDVHTITRIDNGQFSPTRSVKNILAENMTLLPYDGSNEKEILKNSVHDKNIIIKASIDGSPYLRYFVLMGSYNLDGISLRGNDESLFFIEDYKTFQSYDHFWHRILSDAKEAQVIN